MIRLSRARLLLLFLLVAICIVCDRVTKGMAVERLRGEEPIELLGGLLRLAYAENTGAFLGLGGDLDPSLRFALLGVLTGVLLLGVLWALLRSEGDDHAGTVALALIMAAASATSSTACARATWSTSCKSS